MNQSPEARIVQREIVVLILLCAASVVGFLATRSAAAANRARRIEDATFWYDRGQRDLAAGRTTEGIADLRRAIALDRDNRTYHLGLARALADDHQDDAARRILIGVRETSPEDPAVNLQLARLDAHRGDWTSAVRYYQNALYGWWTGDATAPRRQIRIELIKDLLAHDQRARALSEVLVLSNNLPDDATSRLVVAQLLVDAGEPARALDEFRRVLRVDQRNAAALAGAGAAAFQAGDYSTAHRYLHSAGSLSADASEIRAVTDMVLTRDPLQARLSLRDRQERAVQNVNRAVELLAECRASQSSGRLTSQVVDSLEAEAGAMTRNLTLKALRQSPETLDQAVDLVYRIARQTVDVCAAATPLDRALLIIGRRHEAERQ